MAGYVRQAVDAIIRPPRKDYNPDGVPVFVEGPNSVTYVRHPVSVPNSRGQNIRGSIYVSTDRDVFSGLPCVVYMHGNASSQLEGQFLIPNLCPRGLAVDCFDFAGGGASDGAFVSLGHFEKMDVNRLLRTLREAFRLGPFILWGRSMGASTALLVNNPCVVGKVVDSAFSSIRDLIGAIGARMKVPGFLSPGIVFFLKKAVQSKAGFDLTTVCPLDAVRRPNCPPVRFSHAIDDEFVPLAQGEALFAAYANEDKAIVRIEGGHNSLRPKAWIAVGCTFALATFGANWQGYRPVRWRGMQTAEEHFQSYDALMSSMRNERRNADREQPPDGRRDSRTRSGES
jgi:pimeloyl-ACP methyl ester carboxylesterase